MISRFPLTFNNPTVKEIFVETDQNVSLPMTKGRWQLGNSRVDLSKGNSRFKIDNCWVEPRRICRGAVNLVLFRHCPSKIFWKCPIWNLNIQYKNGWYTLQNLTKPVFAFRHWENLVSSSLYPSWLHVICQMRNDPNNCVKKH